MNTRSDTSGEVAGPALAPRLAGCWFALAVAALGIGGALSLVLVIVRVPVLGAMMTADDLLAQRSLIVHVNLSTGVWFLATIAGLCCLLPGAARARRTSIALLAAIVGIIMLTIPVVLGSAAPVLADYIPTLDHWMFLAGLGVFATAILLNGSGREILGFHGGPTWLAADARHAVRAAMVAYVVALLTFLGALASQPADVTALHYYQRLFWGGGHVLQAVNTLGMMAAWLILFRGLTGKPLLGPRCAAVMTAIVVAPFLPGPWLTYADHAPLWFTRMMQFGLFPAPTLLILYGG